MNREEFNSVEKLYHYTSFDKALKILASNKLRFGKLSNMNDIHESYRRKMYELGVNEDDITEELGKYRQFSITRDNHPRRGFDIAAMWAHYADKGYHIFLAIYIKTTSTMRKVMWGTFLCMVSIEIVFPHILRKIKRNCSLPNLKIGRMSKNIGC